MLQSSLEKCNLDEGSRHKDTVRECSEVEEMSAPRLNIFLDHTQEKKGMNSSAKSHSPGYSPNVLLDMRLEIDKLKTENRDLEDRFEEQEKTNSQLAIQNIIWKIESTRLNLVCDELAKRCKTLQGHLEEATRVVEVGGQTGGGTDQRVKELENQLENILAINQKNLESLKYKIMSLDKTRKKNDSLQAENVLLKMALEAIGKSQPSHPQMGSKSPRMTDTGSDRLKLEYSSLSEKHLQLQQSYSVLQKQNAEQENFAKLLDQKVSQMTMFVQKAQEKETKLGEAALEIENLKKIIQELGDQPQDHLKPSLPGVHGDDEGLPYVPNGQGYSDNHKKANIHLQEEPSLLRQLLLELQQIFCCSNRDSSCYYDCEMVRIRIQAITRSLDVMLEDQTCALSETLQKSLVLPAPKRPPLEVVMADISSMCKSVAKCLEPVLSNRSSTTPKLQSRTRSETKILSKSFDQDNLIEELKRENTELRKNQGENLSKPKQESCPASPKSRLDGGDCQQASIAYKLRQTADQLSTSMSQNQQLTALNEELRGQIEQLQDSKKALREQILSLSSKLEHASAGNVHQTRAMSIQDRLEDDINKLVDENRVLRDRLKESEVTLRDKVRECKQVFTELREMKDEAEGKTHALLEMESAFIQLKETLVNELQASKGEIKTLLQQREEFESKLLKSADGESDSKRLQDEVDSLKAELAKLIDQTSKQSTDLEKNHHKQLSDIKHEAQKQIDRLIAQHQAEEEEKNQELAKRISQLQSLEEELDQAEKTIHELERHRVEDQKTSEPSSDELPRPRKSVPNFGFPADELQVAEPHGATQSSPSTARLRTCGTLSSR